jgi:hypothetical protein
MSGADEALEDARDADLPILQDAGVRAFEGLCTREQTRDAARRAFRDVEAASALVPLPPEDARGLWTAPTATPYLSELRSRLEQGLVAAASGYSAYRWLWYLRRLPDEVFKGTLPTTEAYDLALACSVAATGAAREEQVSSSSSPSPSTGPSAITYPVNHPVNQPVAARVLRFAIGCCLLSDVHATLRRVGKGQAMRIEAGRPLPIALRDPRVDAAIDLYDQRVARAGRFLGRSGTVLDASQLTGAADNPFVAVHLTKSYLVPMPTRRDVPRGRLPARFVPTRLGFAELRELNAHPALAGYQWWGSGTVLLLMLMRLAPSYLQQVDHAVQTLLQFGYFVVDRRLFDEVAAAHWQDAASDVAAILPVVDPAMCAPHEFCPALAALRPVLYPVRNGPPIIVQGEAVIVDLWAATAQLQSQLSFPDDQGPVANARGTHFEDAVQRVLDDSPWAPTDLTRKARRVHLRIGGTKVGEIDAVGERDGRVLLLSCKSRVCGDRYDVGEFRDVRNAASLVEGAVRDWATLLDLLRGTPKGDNYDLRHATHLIGAVITPTPIFVSLGPSSEFTVPGLRVASSVEELRQWLQQQGDASRI